MQVVQNATNVEIHFVQPITTTQFAATSATANWDDSTTWNTGLEPDTRHTIDVQNETSEDQRVSVQHAAFVHRLSVAGNTHFITLNIQTGQMLSAVAGTTVGNHGIIELGDETGQGTLVTSSVIIQSGGLLSGNGTVKGNVTIGGNSNAPVAVLRPGFSVGHLDIDGAYTQTANGILAIDVEGKNTGQFDTVAVTGSVQRGRHTSQMNISAMDSTIQAGDTIQIISAGLFMPGKRYPKRPDRRLR